MIIQTNANQIEIFNTYYNFVWYTNRLIEKPNNICKYNPITLITVLQSPVNFRQYIFF